MKDLLEPITTESLKDVFVSKFEALILSGKITSGETLPSERELALQMGVSRPVVHEGLLELSAKGLVTIKSRSGTVVNNLRKEGSLSLLVSLINYHGDKFAPHIQSSILDMRLLFEVENAGLAAINRTEEQLGEFESYLKTEESIDHTMIKKITKLDFAIHHLVAEASGNFLYPLLMNSFKQLHYHLVPDFFSDTNVCEIVFSFHKELYQSIKSKNAEDSRKFMTALLEHGAGHIVQN